MPSPTATHSSLENENDLVFFSQSKGLSSGRLREAINKKKCVNKEIVLIYLDPLPLFPPLPSPESIISRFADRKF